VSLSRKKLQEHCTSVNVQKNRAAQIHTGELGKGNSEKITMHCAAKLSAQCKDI